MTQKDVGAVASVGSSACTVSSPLATATHSKQSTDKTEHSSNSSSSSTLVPFDSLPPNPAKQKPPPCLVGDVQGRVAIIVDDIVDEVEDFLAAAKFLRERGATRVFVVATHALFALDMESWLCKLSEHADHSEHSDQTDKSDKTEQTGKEKEKEQAGKEQWTGTDRCPIEAIVVTNTLAAATRAAERCSRVRVVDVSLLLGEAVRRMQNNESLSYLFQSITGDD